MSGKSILFTACLFGASAFVLADDAHHPDAAAKPPAERTMPKQRTGMDGMHQHMKVMREQMARMRAATDPQEKERLMNEHLKAMEESMSKMHSTMGCNGT